MKQFFTTLLFTGIITLSSAQTPQWLWAIAQNGGNCYTNSYGLIVNKKTGDIYAGGRVAGSMMLGGMSATSGASNAWTARLSSDGVAKWIKVRSFPIGSSDYMYAFAKDDSDNTYAAGLIGSGSTGWYVDKYDSDGNKKWENYFSSPNCAPYGVAADKKGNTYVSGGFSGGTRNFGGSNALTTNGSDDIFIAKYDVAGNCMWAKNFGGTGYESARGISLDNAGNIFIIGNYSAGTTFGSITPPPIGGTIGRNFFILKLDSSANPLWIATATNAGITDGALFWNYATMGVDSCGNIFVGGHFLNTAQFGNLPPITSAGNRDIFIAKCLNSGSWEWVKRAGGSGTDEGEGFAFDSNNDVYMTGYYQSTATFDNQTVSTTATSNLFIAKYANLTGDLQWVATGDPNVGSYAQNLSVDDQGFVYAIGGMDNKTAQFGPSSVTGTAGCGQNILIVKLDTVPQRNIIPYPEPVYCPGSTANLLFDIAGKFNSGNNFIAELSDTAGSFVSPIQLGTLSDSTASGAISITIPSNIPTGDNYVIRIRSTNPAYVNHYYCSSTVSNPVLTTYQVVSINGTLNATITKDTTVCAGSPVQLNAAGGTTYQWSASADLSCTDCATPLASPTITSTYSVKVSGGACSANKTVTVTVDTPVVLQLIADTTVCGGSVNLNPAGSAAYSYSWSPSLGLSCTNCFNPTANPVTSTTYSVTANRGVCSASDDVVVNSGGSFDAGVISATRDTICAGTPGIMNVTGNSGGSLIWQSSSDGIVFTEIPSVTGSSYVAVPPQTTYYRTIAGSGLCADTSTTFRLVVVASPVSDYTYAINGQNVTFTDNSQDATIHEWDFGDGVNSSEISPSHDFNTIGIYHVCLTVYNGSNCSFTTCKDIDLAVGIASVDSDNGWKIYPSPFNEYLIAENSESSHYPVTVELYDVLGRSVVSTVTAEHSQLITIPAYHLAKGIYFLKIKTNSNTTIRKVIKE